MTGICELGSTSAPSAAPEHVRVSVMGGRTQLDLALPVDVPVAKLLPDLAKLVRSRDVEGPADARAAEAHRRPFGCSAGPTRRRRCCRTTRCAQPAWATASFCSCAAEPALSAPTLYDDVVDAAARLNKAAHAGWNAVAARWMSFVGLGITALMWVYFGRRRARRNHRGFGGRDRRDVGRRCGFGLPVLRARRYRGCDGWCTIPVGAAIVWVCARGFGDYGVAAGCALLTVVNAVWYWAIGTGRWGYLASGVVFSGGAVVMFGHHALAMGAATAGAALAILAAFACLRFPG